MHLGSEECFALMIENNLDLKTNCDCAQSSPVFRSFPEQLLYVEVAEERTLNESSMALHGIEELGQHVGLQELLLSLSGKTDTAAALQGSLPFASSTQAVKLHHHIYFIIHTPLLQIIGAMFKICSELILQRIETRINPSVHENRARFGTAPLLKRFLSHREKSAILNFMRDFFLKTEILQDPI